MSKIMYQGTGKRKSSNARVIITPKGTGKITINGRKATEYFPNESLLNEAKTGLRITETDGTFDIKANIKGGGFSGQAGALKYGIVKALIVASADYRKPLKEAGLIARDARVKERKKPGLKSARRAPQFSKR